MQNVFLLVDTETSNAGTVCDFSAIVVNSKCEILHRIAVLTPFFYTDGLFVNPRSRDPLWQVEGLKKRVDRYNQLLADGDRTLANISAINRWLDRVISAYAFAKQYKLILTAYNLPYDREACHKSGINLASDVNDQFCLWQASLGNICNKREFKKFTLQNHYFSDRTIKTGSKTMLTNAEVVSHFVKGYYKKEPHDALGDILEHELPNLMDIIKRKKWRSNCKAFNYKDYQLKDNFRVK